MLLTGTLYVRIIHIWEVSSLSPKAKANTQRVSTFLSVQHLEALKQEAESKGTNVSALIRMIILEYLAKK